MLKDVYKKTDKNKFDLYPNKKQKNKDDFFDFNLKKKTKGVLIMGKKGQTGGQMISGLLLLVIAVIIFISMVPAMSTVLDESRGCQSFNCPGYIDSDATTATCSATNKTYTASRETKSLACTTTDIWLPILLLAALGGFVALLLSGKLGRPEQPEFAGL
ncbi:hypothetical protein LCGC14_1821830 [marine sediment metagenome]|uniref:Uncharacterized protein n=1 Tax=marine sediment metagenome TaxID=412755 RepID=A0A0F9GIU7_9ZZZZ